MKKYIATEEKSKYVMIMAAEYLLIYAERNRGSISVMD
jgi:hypothetical protein